MNFESLSNFHLQFQKNNTETINLYKSGELIVFQNSLKKATNIVQNYNIFAIFTVIFSKK